MIKIRYDMIGAANSGVKIHPQEDMENRNITYSKAEAYSIADCWVFWDCKYTGELPAYMEIK